MTTMGCWTWNLEHAGLIRTRRRNRQFSYGFLCRRQIVELIRTIWLFSVFAFVVFLFCRVNKKTISHFVCALKTKTVFPMLSKRSIEISSDWINRYLQCNLYMFAFGLRYGYGWTGPMGAPPQHECVLYKLMLYRWFTIRRCWRDGNRYARASNFFLLRLVFGCCALGSLIFSFHRFG